VKVKINPLDVLGIRKVNFCPPNFETVDLDKTYNIEAVLSDWIEDNLSGRYFIGDNVCIKDDSIKGVTTVGFEHTKEMSFFMLACPHLKYTR
jgi:hypothetical protein